MTAPIPENESKRLASLRGYEILDTAPEETFDRITRIAATYLNVPTVLVSLVDETRQWFKSRHGLDAEETPRGVAFCAHTILSDQVLVVGDAAKDKRFADNPLVTGEPNIRFYAGAPLCTKDGFNLGTLCAIDYAPREFTKEQGQFLSDMAQVVVDEMEFRLAARKSIDSQVQALKESEERFKDFTNTSSDYFFEMDENLRFSYFSDRFKEIAGISPQELLGKTRQETGIPGLDAEDWQRHLADLDAHRPFRDFIHPRTHPDGHVVYLSISGVPVDDADGNFTGYRCTGTDKTAEVESRRALEESEERFRTVVDNLPIGVNLKDLDSRYLLINKQLAAWYGVAEKDLLGKTAAEALDEPQAAKATRSESERQLLETAAAVTREEEKQRADGRSQVMIISKFPVFDAGGNLTGFGSASTDITELKHAERELKDAREQLDNIISNLPGGIYRRVRHLDGAESLEYNMGQIPQTLGVETHLGESSPRFVSDIALPGYRKIRDEAVRKSAETMERCVFEYPIRMPNDSIVWVQSISMPHRRENGEIVWDGLNFDITARKQVEEALRESQEHFQSVIDNLPSFISLKDADGRFQLINRKHVDMFSLELQDILGKSSFDLHPKKVADKDSAQERKVMETKSVVTEVRASPTKLGTREFLVTKFPIFDKAGAIKGLGTIGTDITERKQAEEALRENENLLNSIIENIPVALLIKDSDHVVERANSTYLNWYGFGEGTMEGRRSDEIKGFQPAAEVEKMNAQEREVLTTGTTLVRQVERPFADGRIHTISITKFPVYDRQGNITKVGSVGFDLTEQVQANKAKSEFLAHMSHDLRTPLNAILGFADFISNQYFGPVGDKYQVYAKDIHSSGELLLSLVNDILDLSAIEVGKRSLAKENISITDVVTECEKFIAEKVKSLGIDLIVEVPKDHPPLYADRRAIMQILLNLLSNAVKFTPEGGKITLRATATNDHHSIEVSDTGTGIPADKIASISDPFVRGETDPHKSQEGTGLGLTIIKSLVDLHDGDLDIKSTVGKGTTVTVTLPNDVSRLESGIHTIDGASATNG